MSPGLVQPEIINAKVLVVGAGFAGLWAALRAAELTHGVVMIDKGHVSRAGTSTLMGGVTHSPSADDDLDAWMREFTSHGGYMCNQDWLLKMWELQRERLSDYERWGVPMGRDDRGCLLRYVSRGMEEVRCATFNPKEAVKQLVAQVEARGVRILSRVAVTGLLTSDGELPTHGRVVGAVGVDTRSCKPIHLKARATVLATGMFQMKGAPGGVTFGEGNVLAFEAGAQLANPEVTIFGTLHRINRRYLYPSWNVAVAHDARLVNRLGERFMERYDRDRLERSEAWWVMAACLKEIIDGRGPVYMDLREKAEEFLESNKLIQGEKGIAAFKEPHSPDPRTHLIPIEGTWRLRGGGEVRIDSQCQTAVPALFAAGSAAHAEAAGRHNSGGMPSAWANASGYVAGEQAARCAAEMKAPEAPQAMMREQTHKALKPLQARGLHVNALYDALGRIEGNAAWATVLSDEHIERSLAGLEEVLGYLAEVRAPDPHELVKAHELRFIVRNLHLGFEAALHRTESRDRFNRWEYPYMDDRNWHCWHVAELTPRGTRFSRDFIDNKRYAIQPPPGYLDRPKRFSPIVAIMSGAVAQGEDLVERLPDAM